MVANNRSESIGSEEVSPMTSLSDDVTNNESNLACPHCNFRCKSAAIMTQHSWELHPLLMRRKKHLISSSKVDATTSSSNDATMHGSTTFVTKTPPIVSQTAQEMQKCRLSANDPGITDTNKEDLHQQGRQETANIYRSNAVRSLSLLSTAAAILEGQSNAAPQRHVAVVKPQPVEVQPACPFPQYESPPVYTPMYNAYIPGLNQFVTLPHGSVIPHPTMLNTSIENAMKAYLSTHQPQNTQFTPQLPTQHLPYYTPQNTHPHTMSQHTAQQPAKPTTDEIRSLLQSSNNPTRKMVHVSKPPHSAVKPHKSEPVVSSQATISHFPQPTLDKERVQALEKAILSTDYCDINDSSTTMPFKCADGVWRMVKFKCIKGLWVVQTPDSSTPTVYVPCDDKKLANKTAPAMRRTARSLSDTSGHKRKLSDGSGSDVDAKRLCASAPVSNVEGGNPLEKGNPLKRTLSNPFITKSLPPASQHFTNNEGKRVNISVIKRNSPQPTSCNLIKSLLLRKSSPPQPMMMSSPVHMTSSSSISSGNSSSSTGMQCKSAPESPLAAAINMAKPLLKSSMAF